MDPVTALFEVRAEDRDDEVTMDDDPEFGMSLLLERLIEDEFSLLLEAWTELVEETEDSRLEQAVARLVWDVEHE